MPARRMTHCNCLLVFLFLLAGTGPARIHAQPVIQHTPPGAVAAGTDLRLAFALNDFSGRVLLAKLYFKSEGEATYRSVDLTGAALRWQGTIPGRLVRGNSLSYFCSLLLDNQSIVTWPAANPYNRPHQLTLEARPLSAGPESVPPSVPPAAAQLPPAKAASKPAPAAVTPARPAAGTAAQPPRQEPAAPPGALRQEPASQLAEPESSGTVPPSFQLLTPEADESVADAEVLIAISYYDETSELDPHSVVLLLDNIDLTSRAEITPALISCDPPPLDPGRHLLQVSGRDNHGRAIPDLQVRFFVESQKEQAAAGARPSFQGHLYADALHESFAGEGETIGMAGADFSGKTGPFTWRGNLFLTSLEDRAYQPRNRYGFSLTSRIIGLSAGDTYPRMHELILAGRRVRGVAGYLHLGLFNLDMVYGQLQRPVKSRFTRAANSAGVPLTGVDGRDSLQVSRRGTYGQSIIGLRPSLGDGRVFQLGMTLVRIRDDSTSITGGLYPQDNLVLGPDVKLALFSGRLLLTGAAAASILTRDISYGPSSADDIKRSLGGDELPFDPAELADLLILNDSSVPLNPAAGSSLAWFLNLQFNHWQQSLNLGYRSIGAEYLSLANPWLRRDLRGLYLQDRIRLLQNKIYLTLGYEQYADNFSEENGNPSIDMRTINYGVSLYPGGIYPQLSISLRDQLRDNGIDQVTTDRVRISSVSDTLIQHDEREKTWFRDLVIQLSQEFRLLEASHQLSLSFISSRNIDEYEEERTTALASPDLSNRLLLLSLATRYTRPWTSTLSYSSNHSEGAAFSAMDYRTIALQGEHQWLDGRMSTFAEFRHVTVEQSLAGGAGSTLQRRQWHLGSRWSITSGQTLLLEGQIWNYSVPSPLSGENDGESLIRLRYDRYF